MMMSVFIWALGIIALILIIFLRGGSGQARKFRKLLQEHNNAIVIPTWIKGREVPCLVFLIGFLLATALRLNNAVFSSNFAMQDKNIPGLNLMQDKVVFVMGTRFKLEQVPILTKIAQSLFPVRDKVLWVIVSNTDEEDLILKKNGNKNKGRNKPSKDKDNKTVKMARKTTHLTNLHKVLLRFGIPFVLMEKNCANNNNGEEESDTNIYHDYEWTVAKLICGNGLVTGVDWVLKNIYGGVLMIGDENFAYHHRIFKEVQRTNIASAWAVGLGRLHGFSSPIWNKTLKVVTGYFHGNSSNFYSNIPIEIGGAAIRIEYLQKNPRLQNILIDALVFQEELTFDSLSIPNQEIQVLGNNGNEILVWRTFSKEQTWPKSLRYFPSFENSSIVKLWQNTFTVMYDQLPVDENVEIDIEKDRDAMRNGLL